jgi:hypothetical protein
MPVAELASSVAFLAIPFAELACSVAFLVGQAV